MNCWRLRIAPAVEPLASSASAWSSFDEQPRGAFLGDLALGAELVDQVADGLERGLGGVEDLDLLDADPEVAGPRHDDPDLLRRDLRERHEVVVGARRVGRVDLVRDVDPVRAVVVLDGERGRLAVGVPRDVLLRVVDSCR